MLDGVASARFLTDKAYPQYKQTRGGSYLFMVGSFQSPGVRFVLWYLLAGSPSVGFIGQLLQMAEPRVLCI